MVSICLFSRIILSKKVCNFLGSCSTGESGGFCCQVPPDPALKCYLQGLNFGTITALRGNSHRSIVVISNYKFRPDDGGTMPGKRPSFTLPVEPISPPPEPATAAPWIAPSVTGFGGGAGYRPRVRRAYFDAVYRHSRARRRIEYSTPARFSKATRRQPAARRCITRAGFCAKPGSLGRKRPM